MSNIDELISSGRELTPHITTMWTNIPIWALIIISILLLFMLLMIIVSISEREYGVAVNFPLVSSVLIFLFLVLPFYNQVSNPEYEQWKEEALNFISNLPKEKYEILYIKIDPEMTSHYHGTFFLGTGVILTTIEKAVPVTVAYKEENEVRIETFWTYTNMKLSESEKPYLSYQNLPKSLGHGIESGWYNPVVHLPSNYEFTDIK